METPNAEELYTEAKIRQRKTFGYTIIVLGAILVIYGTLVQLHIIR